MVDELTQEKPLRRFFLLTDSGRRVAEKLADIEIILSTGMVETGIDLKPRKKEKERQGETA